MEPCGWFVDFPIDRTKIDDTVARVNGGSPLLRLSLECHLFPPSSQFDQIRLSPNGATAKLSIIRYKCQTHFAPRTKPGAAPD